MELKIQQLDAYHWIDQDEKFKIDKDFQTGQLKIQAINPNYSLTFSDLLRIDLYFNIISISIPAGSIPGTTTEIGTYNDFESAFALGLGQIPQLETVTTGTVGTYTDFLTQFENGLN